MPTESNEIELPLNIMSIPQQPRFNSVEAFRDPLQWDPKWVPDTPTWSEYMVGLTRELNFRSFSLGELGCVLTYSNTFHYLYRTAAWLK